MMKGVYPILLSPGEDFVLVTIPDFDVNTQGTDLSEAIEMARDAIGLMGIDMQDHGEEIPAATPMSAIQKESEDDIVTLVDVDFMEYRKKNDMKVVKKNCTIPSWLNYAAEQAGINFSNLLAEAIKNKLQLPDRVY